MLSAVEPAQRSGQGHNTGVLQQLSDVVISVANKEIEPHNPDTF